MNLYKVKLQNKNITDEMISNKTFKTRGIAAQKLLTFLRSIQFFITFGLSDNCTPQVTKNIVLSSKIKESAYHVESWQRGLNYCLIKASY